MMAKIEMIELNKNNKPPKRCNKKRVTELGTKRIQEINIDESIEEI